MGARLELVPADGDDERALVRKAVAGDEAAFERLYHAHAGRVFALCLRMSRSRQEATELMQDVFVHVWERLHSWRGESALSSWIHRVTVNVVLGNIRTRHRRLTHEMPDESGPEREAPDIAVAPPSIEDAIDLERAIATLPAGARAVFILHDVEGYRHAEIAALTGTAEGTCRAQLHRARKLLLEELDR
jgi:RNA polymerase sigma-70 factor (ECF subfamily)